MREQLNIFLRGFIIVTLVALNVRHVAELDYAKAFITGGLVSLVWFGNAKAASGSKVPGARWLYAAGAACGTVAGMWLGRH